jgi:hypothetical protein
MQVYIAFYECTVILLPIYHLVDIYVDNTMCGEDNYTYSTGHSTSYSRWYVSQSRTGWLNFGRYCQISLPTEFI